MNLSERLRGSFPGQFLGRETWALSDQAVLSGTNFLTNVMLARYMGLREFGVFALAWMSVLFVNSLQTALIISPMMSISPQQEEKDRPFYFGAVFFHELVHVSVSFVLVFAGLKLSNNFFPHEHLRQLALPLAFSAFAYQMQDFLRRYFFATHQSFRALADDALSYLTQLPILFFLHRAGVLTSATALWVMAGTSILGLAGWFWVEPLNFRREWITAIWHRHWRCSRWLSGASLLQWTSGNLFILAAPIYYGPAAVGALKAGQNLMRAANLWYVGLDNVVPVEAARRLHANGLRSMLAYLRLVLLKWGGLTLLFALVMAAASGFWLRLFYGPEMVPYGYILRDYALIYTIMFVGSPLCAGLRALEFTAPIFWSYVATTAFALAFASPLARRLGLNGVMIGLFGTQALLQSILSISLFLKSRRFARATEIARQSTQE
jgi:O-antigen/teichoic acid export membrane protein